MYEQMDIAELLESFNKVYPVDIAGICDDAYCPTCGYGFMYPSETDMSECRYCGTRLDWSRWHRMNDND